MNSNNPRRSRAGPSHDDSPPENRQRPIQKSVQYIPGEHFLAWGERWSPAPPRQKSNKASTNSSVFTFEHGLNEFKLDSPPRTPLTPDNQAPSPPPIVRSHPGRITKRKNTKRKNRRARICAPYLASSLHQSQSTYTRASTEERDLDILTSGSFSTPLQAECVVATSSAMSGGSLTPDSEFAFYPVPKNYDDRSLLLPAYSHYQHEMSAGSLTQRNFQILPYGASTIDHSPVMPFPDTTLRWVREDGASFLPSIPPAYYHHDLDGNQGYVDAMGRGTFLNHYSSDLPHLSEPYTQPRGQTLHQRPAYGVNAPDKHIPSPYNLEDSQS